jgi:hypothetical protein
MEPIRTQDDNYNGFYRGKVLSQLENGKCKIFVPGVYPDEFETNPDALPEAEPCQPLMFGGYDSNNGSFQYPDIGTVVWLFFESSDINRPVFFGSTIKDKGNFDTNKVSMYYHGMYCTFDKSTDTMTLHAPHIVITCTSMDITGETKKETFTTSITKSSPAQTNTGSTKEETFTTSITTTTPVRTSNSTTSQTDVIKDHVVTGETKTESYTKTATVAAPVQTISGTATLSLNATPASQIVLTPAGCAETFVAKTETGVSKNSAITTAITVVCDSQTYAKMNPTTTPVTTQKLIIG